ncbi:MAG: CoB--CoM heterodisulfide reductase iron-sulfur subunit B family protein [Spirochaetes bacterium]|nr:CoB--CoM heterodisulfide reductase iron-sulfur subunit B family protein [Spirochaetota bacterium]
MKYAYYPGCSAESTARDQYSSTKAVAKALGIDLVEPGGWTCCGSTPAHQVNHDLALSLAAANLLKVKDRGLDMVVSCASCYSRMKIANHEIRNNPGARERVASAIGRDYDGSVPVRHFIEVLLEDLGIEALKGAITHSLGGIKVASYYGCLLVRPAEVTGFDDPENPVSMDRLVAAMGGESLEWPHKVECCGASLTLTRSDLVEILSGGIVDLAREAGADCIAVACPMCQINLDMRQGESQSPLPVLYITQLLGLCLGISHHSLGLSKLIHSPKAIAASVARR